MKFVILAALLSVSAYAKVDLTKSTFQWTGSKVIAGSHTGTVNLKSAELVEEKGQIKSGNFVIDLNTIKATDITGDKAEMLAGHLKNADFFDVAKYPTASFKITKAEGSKVTGDLTIKNKTQPVTIDLKKSGSNYTGKLVFDRTKFDVMYSSAADKSTFEKLEAAAKEKIIKNEIEIDFTIVNN